VFGAPGGGSGGGTVTSPGDSTTCTEVQIPTGNLPGDPVAANPHEALYGSDPAPFAVHLGLPTRDPSTSVSMIWRTPYDRETDDRTGAAVVQIGTTDAWPDDAWEVEGYTFPFASGQIGAGTAMLHEARICGDLTPNTAYTYRVGGPGGWSAEHRFSTPGPPGGADPLRIAFVGDSRGGYDTWSQILTELDAAEPDLIVFSGDMVDLGGSQTDWDAWFAAGGDIIARRIVVPAHGNHEYLAQNYFAQFGLPGNELWFAIDIGDMLLVTLNDTVTNMEHINTVQPAFLSDELSGTEARWRIVQHHKPMYTTSTSHASDLDLRALWSPIVEAHEVDVVVTGHNHLYERSVPILDGVEVGGDEGTVYMVTGGAGAPLYTGIEPDWFGEVASAVNHYVLADFGRSGADFVVRDLSGNVIDSWHIDR
jgi:hypothetical protein